MNILLSAWTYFPVHEHTSQRMNILLSAWTARPTPRYCPYCAWDIYSLAPNRQHNKINQLGPASYTYCTWAIRFPAFSPPNRRHNKKRQLISTTGTLPFLFIFISLHSNNKQRSKDASSPPNKRCLLCCTRGMNASWLKHRHPLMCTRQETTTQLTSSFSSSVQMFVLLHTRHLCLLTEVRAPTNAAQAPANVHKTGEDQVGQHTFSSSLISADVCIVAREGLMPPDWSTGTHEFAHDRKRPSRSAHLFLQLN